MKTVLYVEDEPDDVFFMQRAFDNARLEARLISVADGRAALAYLAGEGTAADRANHPLPDVLLIDLNMPLVSGFDVLRSVRQSPTLGALPVIVFTSSSQPSDQHRAAELGATAYWVKPSNPERLIRIISELHRYW